MGTSRTKNSARNMSVAIIAKLVALVLSFICRTVFINVLGAEYLGFNGLFSNILSVLSFAELGAGTALLYRMYKPVAENDQEKIKSLMHLYKTVFNVIGIVIFILGLAVLPFLPFLMKDSGGVDFNHIALYYVLFLTSASISYFFAYKRSLITSHQQDYIVSLINLFAVVLTNVLEIVFLLTTHNYIAYLLVQIGGALLENIMVSRKANKMYPYIKDREFQKISKFERKSFFKDVKVLFLRQTSFALLQGTDNIIISAFIGVTEVGLLSNYTLITTTIYRLLETTFNAITPSIGNLNTIKDRIRKEKVFYQIFFISFIVYGYISIMVTLLLNKFITVWLGGEYVLGIAISLALGLDLFISGTRYAYCTYRNTSSLFRKAVYLPVVTVMANILLSILLVNILPLEGHWKIFGVLIATPITKIIFQSTYEPYLIHKYMFKTSALKYYKMFGYYAFVTLLAGIVSYFAINAIPVEGIVGFVIDGIVGTLIVAMVFWLFTFKTTPYREVKKKLMRLVRKKI